MQPKANKTSNKIKSYKTSFLSRYNQKSTNATEFNEYNFEKNDPAEDEILDYLTKS